MKKLRTLLTSIVVLLCSVSVSAYGFIVKDGNYKLCYNITSAKDRTVVFAKCIDPQFSIDKYSITIPRSVVFNGITYSVTEIGSFAFENAYLTNVVIPNSVTEIRYGAFIDCWQLESIVIPSSVTEIGPSAFKGCDRLKSVVIPNSVKIIDMAAFEGCRRLLYVVSESKEPPTLEMDAYNNTSSKAVLFVPAGSKKAYKKALKKSYAPGAKNKLKEIVEYDNAEALTRMVDDIITKANIAEEIKAIRRTKENAKAYKKALMKETKGK